MRRTKIICTLGPASDTDELVRSLIQRGMNCARLNFSHGMHEEHAERISRVRRISDETDCNVAVMLDTKGPEIRLGDFKSGSIILEKNKEFILDDRQDKLGDERRVAISYPELLSQLEEGTSVLIDDGKVALKVKSINPYGDSVTCTVINAGKISNRKGINVPNFSVDIPFISEYDRNDILFGIEHNVDYIAASFVRSADDVRELRDFLDKNGGESIRIISKIENRQGVDNIDNILKVTDGIMVARGDLGVEIPFMKIPTIQKNIISKCNRIGKIVVTATQMLESMTQNPRPTRAEVSDVANAVFDGTDAIMLSGETAAGAYPVKAVQTMAEIAEASEKSVRSNKSFVRESLKLNRNIRNAVCASAYSAAEFLHAGAIVVLTRGGRTAKHISDFRPGCPIVAIVMDEKARRQLSLEWGVYPMAGEYKSTAHELFKYAQEKALESGIVKSGDTIVVITSSDTQMAYGNDIIRIAELK
ncbi:MAG: pyruvate kinase [Anaerovoracaceae bacterium]